ncbi:MAG: hypothetical protein PHH97_05740 [Candidatus Cloacimonetes bacterium]|nr:hypothetical protein [Candidatus Cloacimonadota bacterium]
MVEKVERVEKVEKVEKVERASIAYKLRERKMSKRKKKGESVKNIRGDLPITITAIESCPILNIKNICGFLTKKDSYTKKAE